MINEGARFARNYYCGFAAPTFTIYYLQFIIVVKKSNTRS